MKISDQDYQNDAASANGWVIGGGATRERQRIGNPSEDPKMSSPSLPFSPHENDAPLRSMPVLVDDLIAEILSRVPVKSLLQFRCVCKSWKSLISSPQFVKNHLHRSVTDPNLTHYQLLLRIGYDEENHTSYPVPSLSNYASYSVPSLPNNPSTVPDVNFPSQGCHLIGSCNGLLCFLNQSGHLIVVNPSTRFQSRESPFLGDFWDFRFIDCYGFGYDHANEKYKAVALMGRFLPVDQMKPSAKLYTLASNSWNWKEIEWPPVSLFGRAFRGQFVSGTLNWLGMRTRGMSVDELVVISFDIEKEMYRVLLIPGLHDVVLPNIQLGTLKDCLCLVHAWGQKNCSILWLMKEYGVEESWTKLATIPYLDLDRFDNQFAQIKAVCVTENGEFLISVGFLFFMIIPRGMILRHPLMALDYGYILDELTYVESLVSP